MAAADYRLMTEATGQRIAAALESLVNLGDPVTIAHGGTGASTAAAALAALGGVAVTDIVDNLTSTATDKPLSAAQGKQLNDIINQRVSSSNLTNLSTYTADTYLSMLASEGRTITITSATAGSGGALSDLPSGTVGGSGIYIAFTGTYYRMLWYISTSKRIAYYIREGGWQTIVPN
jgi:hypothetical protein